MSDVLGEIEKQQEIGMEDWASASMKLYEILLAKGFDREVAGRLLVVWIDKSTPAAQAPLAPEIAQTYERMSAAMLAMRREFGGDD